MEAVRRLRPRAAALAPLAALALAACVLPSISTSRGAVDAGADGGSSEGGADASIGVGCVTDANGITWCRGVAQCPDVFVSPDLYPNCGFRVRGTGLDLSCWCTGDFVCPLGQPLTCEDARRLLEQQSEQLVCVQVAENRCVSQGASGGAGGKPPVPQGCDLSCYHACGPTAGCKQVCGC